MKILLLGPCSPQDVSDLFDPEYRDEAVAMVGYRGIPVSSLAISLLALGHEVFIVSTSSDLRNETRVFKGRNFEMRIVAARHRARDLALSFFSKERDLIISQIESINPEIINAHWTYEFALAGLATKRPILITAHDAPLTIFKHYFDAYRFFRLLMAAKVRLKSKHFVFVSPDLKNRWRKELLWFGDSKVIPNIAPDLQVSKRLDHVASLNVLIISDASKLKNVKNAIKAWQIVISQYPQAKLQIVGTGLDEGGLLYEWARLNGLNKSISWCGYLSPNEVANKIAISNILLHPSLHESFGLTLIEAMTHGVPVIAGKKSGAVPYVVGDAGVLVNMRKTSEIANALINLLSNRELAKEIGIKGCKRAKSEFASRKVGQLYVSEYERILGELNK
jgi:glycosyltransferase involved in cell wall biosynthesis